jgi:hypothetical protein
MICFEYAERLFHELIDNYHNNSEEYESEGSVMSKQMNPWADDD